MIIDDCRIQDNRQYEYPIDSVQNRAEYLPISNWIKPSSKVIDFGCGDGSLLKFLEANKSIQPFGYDVSRSAISACEYKSIPAACDRIDKAHPDILDKSFNYAICNVTLQMVNFPEILLQEMSRVARYQIVSIPNFAYYKNRIDMAVYGRMPQPMMFGYEWFSTGHIHQLSIKDFHLYIQNQTSLKIEDAYHIGSNNRLLKSLVSTFPNLFSRISIFLLSSAS